MNSLSKKLTLGTVGLFIAAATVVGAENLVKTGDAENTASIKKWHKKLTQNSEDKLGGKSSFHGKTGSIWAFSPEYIEVDPSKAYQLSGALKSIGTGKSKCYIGLAMYTAKKKSIQRPYISIIKGTLTKLAVDAKVGDTVLQIADCSKWNAKRLKRTIVAFGAKKDYSDLPNLNISSTAVKLEKKGEIYELTLKKPLRKAYPAGTEIRQHFTGGGYQYCAASSKIAPNKWTKYSAVVKGLAKYGSPNKQFWPGTKFVKVIVIINYQAKKDSDTQTLFDEVSFSQVD
jgi:hypothetical protein